MVSLYRLVWALRSRIVLWTCGGDLLAKVRRIKVNVGDMEYLLKWYQIYAVGIFGDWNEY